VKSDAWFAGFTDGEGSFNINEKRVGTACYYRPMFTIGLRADDAAVLAELQREFGGSLRFVKPRQKDKAKVHWDVAAKTDLAKLIGYFDAFPLRAKKANDYSIWRQAVLMYCASRQSSSSQEMVTLALALSESRSYRASDFSHLRKSRVTQEDVARCAGVTTRKVKRVVLSEPGVSGITRRRVEDAIRELGYVRPNRRHLTSRESAREQPAAA
jgi:hypothetical protein